MRITAKADYAVRAMVELAVHGGDGAPVKGEMLARSQDLPLKFLEAILGELKRDGLVASMRGADGGYWLARNADTISIADVIRAVEGPLADVRGTRPENLAFDGSAAPLRDVWLAVRASLRSVLEGVTIADVANGTLPDTVRIWLADPETFRAH